MDIRLLITIFFLILIIVSIILKKIFKFYSVYFIFILFIIFFILILNSKTFLENTSEKCIEHIRGKNIFNLSLNGVYNIFNPSILKTDKGYICCFRCSTLSQKNLFCYLYGQFFYESCIVFLEIKENNSHKFIYPCVSYKSENLKGSLEDPRIIEYKNKYIISASEYISKTEIFPVLLIYDKNYNFIRRIEYNRTDYFRSLPFSIQKNWCPFKYNNKLYLHTDTYPIWKVYKLNLNSGKLKKIIEYNSVSFFNLDSKYNLRCSTSWKEYNDTYYICGLHTKSKDTIPTYRSLLVLIDKKTLLPKHKTNILCLEKTRHNRIQYLSGLEVDKTDIILSYGLNDSEIVIKKIFKDRLKWF